MKALARAVQPRTRTAGTEAHRVARSIERNHEEWGDAFLDVLFDELCEAVDFIGYLETQGWRKVVRE